MPTYDYKCRICDATASFVRRVSERNDPVYCSDCDDLEMERVVGSPLFKFTGRVTPGGGPDRFTADMLGIPLKDLPDGLKTPEQPK